MSSEGNVALHVHKDDEATKLGMWLFLFTELTLFGGLFLMYAVYRFIHQADFHIAAQNMDTFIGALNTIILLTSSLTMVLSITAIRRGSKKLSLLFQGITIFFGFIFLLNKYFEWSHEIHLGNFPGSEILLSKSQGDILFFGLYYVMTGLHGLHVIIGMIVIAIMMRFTLKNVITRNNDIKLEAAGLYWHLIDIIWIFLFPLFYLIS